MALANRPWLLVPGLKSARVAALAIWDRQNQIGHSDLFVLAWFVASAATVGLGSGLESDEAIRAAAYSKREQDRRDRLTQERNSEPSTP